MEKKLKLSLMVLGFAALYFLPSFYHGAVEGSEDPLANAMYMLHDYARLHVLTCLLPAFFIAGAISALVPKESITRYLGSNVPKRIAYPLSVIAGFLLAVCSCTVLPLFAGIKKRGAGLGPAIAFLYTAPAINVMAIVFTGGVLGWDLAIARIVLSVVFAVLTGVIIARVFREDGRDAQAATVAEGPRIPFYKRVYSDKVTAFILTLFAILLVGTAGLGGFEKMLGIGSLVLLLGVQVKYRLTPPEISTWLNETYFFLEKIFPLLIVGVFAAGFLSPMLPENFLEDYVGENTIFANLLAVLFGVVMYFPTLVEVPMAQMFLSLGMGRGPLLAYLLADPVLSLPSIIVVKGLIGTRKTLVYVVLVTVFCTVSGYIYGLYA